MTVDDKTDRQAREGVRAREDIADVRDVETSEDMEFDTGTPETHETAGHADNTLQEDAAASRKTMALGGERGISRRLRKLKVVPVAVVLLMAISAALAAWLYFYQYRPDQQTDAGAARVAVAAATEGTVALLSYSPDTVDQDVATARSHLTGDFLSYYDAFT
ncbi:MAG: hypothetical protein ACRDTK_08975, partial [Mycobacterium sp.]